ncbi:hypothetical protein [Streptomyces sp. NPDC086838]|uniref:hypothetical protein n=1 Tax=Streptomyces sp. NPDC086838 TaxID=3365762 RepID=UPI00382B5BFE
MATSQATGIRRERAQRAGGAVRHVMDARDLAPGRCYERRQERSDGVAYPARCKTSRMREFIAGDEEPDAWARAYGEAVVAA